MASGIQGSRAGGKGTTVSVTSFWKPSMITYLHLQQVEIASAINRSTLVRGRTLKSPACPRLSSHLYDLCLTGWGKGSK